MKLRRFHDYGDLVLTNDSIVHRLRRIVKAFSYKYQITNYQIEAAASFSTVDVSQPASFRSCQTNIAFYFLL